MDTSQSPTNSTGMDLLEKSMYDISGNDLLDIWDADIASVGFSYWQDIFNRPFIHHYLLKRLYNCFISTIRNSTA